MIQKNLGEQVSAIVLSGAVAAGQTEIDSSSIDLAGYEGALILVHFGAITTGSVVTIHLEDGATSSPTTDVLGSSQVVADTNDSDVALIDLYAPLKRYARVVITRTGQDAVLNGIVAIRYGARVEAPTNDSASVVALKTLISPAEGTP